MLAGVIDVERVSVESHFFNDLGANSLVMAQFCARIRKRPDLPLGVDEGHLPAPDDPKPRDGPRGREPLPAELRFRHRPRW